MKVSKKAFGNYVKTKREENNLTREELAENLNVSYHVVYKWEMGVRLPDYEMQGKLAEILGVSVQELYDNSLVKENNNVKTIILMIFVIAFFGGAVFFIWKNEGKGRNTAEETQTEEQTTEEQTTEEQTTDAEEEKTVTLFCNTTFAVEDTFKLLPDYEAIEEGKGKLGDINIVFVYNFNDDDTYEGHLDNALLGENIIDIFEIRAENYYRYIHSNDVEDIYSIPGIDNEALAQQYLFQQDILTESGELKGLALSINPTVMYYNKNIAKAVFGTDDSEVIKETVKDWDSFSDTAAKIAEAGYLMTASYADTYGIYAGNKSTPWIINGEISVDNHLKQWADDTKKIYMQNGTTSDDYWSGYYNVQSGNIFCTFGSNYRMFEKADEWGVVLGPENTYDKLWSSGSYLCVNKNTENINEIGIIFNKLIGDTEVLKKIMLEKSCIINNKSLVASLADSQEFTGTMIGGNNSLSVYNESAQRISFAPDTEYDNLFDEIFVGKMRSYILSEKEYDEVLEEFYNEVKSITLQ